MLSGKISEPEDWYQALRDVLSSPFEHSSVLTIISDTTCGSIGVAGNRYITGAHTSEGEYGVAALRQLIALEVGFYSYLSAAAIPDPQNIDQGLQVDITALIGPAVPNGSGQQKPADEATAELRRTFQALQPLSAQRAASAAQVMFSPTEVAPPNSADEDADDGYSYTPGAIEQTSGTGRKRTNPLDKLVYGAKSTCIKLASLSSFQNEQAQNQQSAGNAAPSAGQLPGTEVNLQTGQNPIPPQPHQTGQNLIPPQPSVSGLPAPAAFAGSSMPPAPSINSTLPMAGGMSPAPPQFPQQAPPSQPAQSASRPVPPPPAGFSVNQPIVASPPAPPMNIVESVRATAWRMVSRVAHAANLTEYDERLNDSRKLRILETDTTEDTEAEKAKRKKWPPDAATLSLMSAAGLGALVIIGAAVVAWQMNSTEYFMNAGKKYMTDGRPELAIAQFTLALDKNRDDADALLLRAQVYEQMQDYEHAEADYARLAQVKPNNLSAARRVAFNKFKLKKYEDAAAYCKKLLERDVDDESLKAQYAMNLARLGKYREAATSGGKLDVELVPSYLVPDFFGSLGYAWSQLGHEKRAISFYSRAIDADASNADVLAERAAMYVTQREYKKAQADLLAVTKIYPERGSAYVDLAKAYELGKDYTSAAAQYENAIKHGATADLYMQLAQCHLQLGKPGYAVSDCDAALSLDPRAKGANRVRAIALERAKREKALVIAQIPVETYVPVRETRQEVKQSAKDPLTEVGYAQLSAKDPQTAVTTLNEAIRRTPSDMAAHRYLAQALTELQRDQEAFDQYNLIAQSNALLPSDDLDYARAAGLSGHSDRAIELFFVVLNRDPTYLAARVDLIKTLVAKGFLDRADAVAQEGVRINPGNAKTLKEALNYRPGN